MLISVSIIDAARKAAPGQPGHYHHVGSYTFEIDYPASADIDCIAGCLGPDGVEQMQPHLNKLMTLKDFQKAGIDLLNGLGEDAELPENG